MNFYNVTNDIIANLPGALSDNGKPKYKEKINPQH